MFPVWSLDTALVLYQRKFKRVIAQLHEKNHLVILNLTLEYYESDLLRFSKTRNLRSSKANWRLRFSLPSIIIAELLGNRTLLKRVQKVMVCDLWLVDLDPFLWVPSSKFVACDRNYDWRQRKTQLWRRVLNFRVLWLISSRHWSDLGRYWCAQRRLGRREKLWLPVFLLSFPWRNTNSLKPSHQPSRKQEKRLGKSLSVRVFVKSAVRKLCVFPLNS